MSTATSLTDAPAARSRGWRWFLTAWTVFAMVFVGVVWRFGGIGEHDQVFVLHDNTSGGEAFADAARRNLLLAHLSLSRIYPWVLLAPYVVWAASRFSLERENLRRNLLIQGLLGSAFVAGCQWLNQQLVAGQSLRVVVSVRETSSIDSGTNGIVRGTVRRKEMHISRMNPSNSPAWAGAMIREVETDRDGEPGVHPRPHRNGATAWNPDLTEVPDPEMPFGFLWRGRIVSAGLDLLVFVSLSGLGHAAHFRRRFQERERRAMALESSLAHARLHTLQAQLQPHFLFNTLNSITALVRQHPAAAEEMLTSLSDLLRLALNNAGRSWSTVREELRFLQLYFEIQRMRFGDRLSLEQDIDPAALDCVIPSLLLQPLVENAVRHGLEPAGRPGTVRVGAKVRGQVLDLTVDDDGVGCPGLLCGSALPGVGLTNVREQLKAMFDQDSSLTFAERAFGGLEVRIQVPVRIAGREPEAPLHENPLSYRG